MTDQNENSRTDIRPLRRGPLLLAAACWVLALPLLLMNFVGTLGIAWKLIMLALMAAGAVVFWRERRHASRP